MARFNVGDRLALLADKNSQRRVHTVTVAAVRQGAEEASYCLQDRGAPALWVGESRLLRLGPVIESPSGN
jgi:hypothetical protein